MTILLLLAGTNEQSNSAMLADAFAEGARAAGATVDILRLRELHIEHFTLDCYKNDYPHEPDFLQVQRAVQGAHGLVIATPIWNFGVPAHLKNLIDRMGSFALDPTHSKGTLGGKPLFTIFTGGAPLPAWLGLMRKTTSFVAEGLRYFGATPCGTSFEPKCTPGRGVFGVVVDKRPDSLAKARRDGAAFACVVEAFAKDGTLPAAQGLLRKCYALGQKIMKAL